MRSALELLAQSHFFRDFAQPEIISPFSFSSRRSRVNDTQQYVI
jgi:hypothetical protein